MCATRCQVQSPNVVCEATDTWTCLVIALTVEEFHGFSGPTSFATALGLTRQRPDLVVRFGRGPALPRSLWRPVEAVLV